MGRTLWHCLLGGGKCINNSAYEHVRAAGVQVVVQRATNDVYAALIDSKLCVKVGYGNWSPGEAGVQVC